MIIKSKIKTSCFCLLWAISLTVSVASAQNISTEDVKSQPRVEVFMSPRFGSFVEGSNFEVPIFINTNGTNVRGLNIKINFDKDKLEVARPSGGTSIIDVWLESPKYNNTKGTISYVGTIPEGIVVTGGLVATITFKALGSGQAKIAVSPLLDKRKEFHERDILEKEKIENLEKDLDEAKLEIDKKIKDEE